MNRLQGKVKLGCIQKSRRTSGSCTSSQNHNYRTTENDKYTSKYPALWFMKYFLISNKLLALQSLKRDNLQEQVVKSSLMLIQDYKVIKVLISLRFSLLISEKNITEIPTKITKIRD